MAADTDERNYLVSAGQSMIDYIKRRNEEEYGVYGLFEVKEDSIVLQEKDAVPSNGTGDK